MDRLLSKNVIALQGELLKRPEMWISFFLIKQEQLPWATGRQWSYSMAGHTEQEVANGALFASLTDETPEGRSVVVLAKNEIPDSQ